MRGENTRTEVIQMFMCGTVMRVGLCGCIMSDGITFSLFHFTPEHKQTHRFFSLSVWCLAPFNGLNQSSISELWTLGLMTPGPPNPLRLNLPQRWTQNGHHSVQILTRGCSSNHPRLAHLVSRTEGERDWASCSWCLWWLGFNGHSVFSQPGAVLHWMFPSQCCHMSISKPDRCQTEPSFASAHSEWLMRAELSRTYFCWQNETSSDLSVTNRQLLSLPFPLTFCLQPFLFFILFIYCYDHRKKKSKVWILHPPL